MRLMDHGATGVDPLSAVTTAPEVTSQSRTTGASFTGLTEKSTVSGSASWFSAPSSARVSVTVQVPPSSLAVFSVMVNELAVTLTPNATQSFGTDAPQV